MNAPEHLDDQARQKWDELVPILQERGDLDQGVADALACYCSAWSRWITAEQKVSELGAVVRSAAGFAQANPFVGIAAAAQRQLRQWGAELGLTPLAKKRAKTSTKPEPTTSILAKLKAFPAA